ncbi:MAG: hypothetical protein ONB46_25865 [candidate division KSB1 bacterium]|nr:hypothetical protein [candidate division KSB1 bacterium]MDZ7369350.1 hypothetical protein [candidate division KSB1 bacterium]MDZ7407395.1 hypothetical protein [candidate division KSB1 bacterium]
MKTNRAAEWGREMADHFLTQRVTNPFLLAMKFGWRVVLENDETSDGSPPRLAEWDGSRRLIRLFIPTLRRHFGISTPALQRACAHELFHGLAAIDYLPTAGLPSPRLNHHEEEIAAQAFSLALLTPPVEELCLSSDSR